MLVRRHVPERVFGDKLIVARPSDGAPVVLAPTAVLVWQSLADWTTIEGIDACLADSFPEVHARERADARRAILAALCDDDLLDR
jgi:hypothetical protein